MGESPIYLLGGLVWLAGGVVLWRIAPRVVDLATTGVCEDIHLGGVTERNLYSVTFVGIGTFFAVDAFPAIYQLVHYFIQSQHEVPGFTADPQVLFSNMTESGLQFVAAITLIYTARRWARKLTKGEQDDDGKPDPGPS